MPRAKPALSPPSRGVGPAAADEIQIFADVPLDHPNRQPIEWAAGKGLVRGFPDGTFRPRSNLTRGQLTTILHNRKAAA